MHLDHRRRTENLQDHDAKRRPCRIADDSSLTALANADDDSDQMAEKHEREYPVRHMDVEWSSAHRDCPAPRKPLARDRRSGRVGGECPEYEHQKREPRSRASRAHGPLVASRDGAVSYTHLRAHETRH